MGRGMTPRHVDEGQIKREMKGKKFNN